MKPFHYEGLDHTTNNAIKFGFTWSNSIQLFYHFILASFIGITLRMTTFKDATIAAHLSQYKRETSFLISFGFTKAVTNVVVGWSSDKFGRKITHSIGWISGVALGIMLLILTKSQTSTYINENNSDNDESRNESNWLFFVLANIFLGVQQGSTWTTNIFMWMDILGPDHQALASGISNSVGYLSSAVSIYIAASISSRAAFSVVFGCCFVGLLLSVILVTDTGKFVEKEVDEVLTQSTVQQRIHSLFEYNDSDDGRRKVEEDANEIITNEKVISHDSNNDTVILSNNNTLARRSGQVLVETPLTDNNINIIKSDSFSKVVYITCWQNKNTAIICLGGLMANLVTAFAWGLVLLWGQQHGLSTKRIANIGSTFTFSKAIMMVLSGHYSDVQRKRKKNLIAGFLLAILGLVVTSLADIRQDSNSLYLYLVFGGIMIGSGIGSVYCVLTGAISDHTFAQDRASAIGVYKFWRDSGYAFGGLLTGYVADWSGGSFILTTLVVATVIAIFVFMIACSYQEASNAQEEEITAIVEKI